MLRYILLRLALLVPVMLGASLLVFVLLHLGSTDRRWTTFGFRTFHRPTPPLPKCAIPWGWIVRCMRNT